MVIPSGGVDISEIPEGDVVIGGGFGYAVRIEKIESGYTGAVYTETDVYLDKQRKADACFA